ncbi:MAG: hypothetical protein F7C38_00760 [Desulfurococcales archaeon]|nr:hypothetical protein [Desulfurococcales archaeon]
MAKGSRKRNIMKTMMEALALVRRAQIEVRRAKARAKTMSKLLSEAEYRELATSLETLDIVLEKIALRLQTMLVAGVINRELLEAPREILRKAMSISSMIPPNIGETLAEISDAIDMLISSAPTMPEEAPSLIEMSESSPSDYAESVLREAREEARRRLEGLSE